jgi:glutaredoxin-related protein
MTRNILDEAHIHPAIRETIANNRADIVRRSASRGRLQRCCGWHEAKASPKARKALEAAAIPYKYLECRSYLNTWRRRNALKMWTGWPTFPMVFVKGIFVGGADDLSRLIESGELKAMLAGKR